MSQSVKCQPIKCKVINNFIYFPEAEITAYQLEKELRQNITSDFGVEIYVRPVDDVGTSMPLFEYDNIKKDGDLYSRGQRPFDRYAISIGALMVRLDQDKTETSVLEISDLDLLIAAAQCLGVVNPKYNLDICMWRD